MNKLKTVKRRVRKVKGKRIAVIEFRGDKGVSKKNCRVEVKRGTDLAKLANMKKG